MQTPKACACVCVHTVEYSNYDVWQVVLHPHKCVRDTSEYQNGKCQLVITFISL